MYYKWTTIFWLVANILIYMDDVIIHTSHKFLNLGIRLLKNVWGNVSIVFKNMYFIVAPNKSKCMIFQGRRITVIHNILLLGTAILYMISKTYLVYRCLRFALYLLKSFASKTIEIEKLHYNSAWKNGWYSRTFISKYFSSLYKGSSEFYSLMPFSKNLCIV